MSKIGKKPIPLASAKIQIKENIITITGPKVTFEHELPPGLTVSLSDDNLYVKPEKVTRQINMLWGLHRALLANKVKGVTTGFEQKINIVGLGFKAQLAGKKMTLTLGYTHKIDYELPQDVSVEIDKTGQKLTFRSANKLSLGNVCDAIRSFRPPEPYKGIGVIREGETIIRKAGKTKAA